MKALVLGAGGVGRAIANIASRRKFISEMVIADRNLDRAEDAVDRLNDSRFSAAVGMISRAPASCQALLIEPDARHLHRLRILFDIDADLRGGRHRPACGHDGGRQQQTRGGSSVHVRFLTLCAGALGSANLCPEPWPISREEQAATRRCRQLDEAGPVLDVRRPGLPCHGQSGVFPSGFG